MYIVQWSWILCFAGSNPDPGRKRLRWIYLNSLYAFDVRKWLWGKASRLPKLQLRPPMCPGSCISCSYNYLENFTFSSTSWVNIINHEIIRSLYWECNAEFIFYICHNGMSNNEMCGMKRLHWGSLFIFMLGIWNSFLSAILLVCDGTRPINMSEIYLFVS